MCYVVSDIHIAGAKLSQWGLTSLQHTVTNYSLCNTLQHIQGICNTSLHLIRVDQAQLLALHDRPEKM